jgi:hypothetical protein
MPYDIFMIAYGEPNREENWAHLLAIVPKDRPAPRRVENIPGLFASHAACARASTTPWFFVVDADNWIRDGFDFAVPFAPAADEIAVWGATNPFNDLYYGHGGIKLLPVSVFEAADAEAHSRDSLDFTVTIARNRFIDRKASEHRFNTSAYGTWGAVFRECAKLASRGSLKARAITNHRLKSWLNVNPEARFAEWCRRGAEDGILYGRTFSRDPAALNRINDFAWMRTAFRARYEAESTCPPKAG